MRKDKHASTSQNTHARDLLFHREDFRQDTPGVGAVGVGDVAEDLLTLFAAAGEVVGWGRLSRPSLGSAPKTASARALRPPEKIRPTPGTLVEIPEKGVGDRG